MGREDKTMTGPGVGLMTRYLAEGKRGVRQLEINNAVSGVESLALLSIKLF